jgi:hypothetical protein
MISKLLKLLNKIPQPYRLIVFLVVCVALISVFFVIGNQVRSCGYSRGRAEYDAEKAAWSKEREAWNNDRAKLIAEAEAKDKRIAELEPKAIAFDAVAETNKRIDANLASQIDEVSKNAGIEETNALLATDCLTRANRVCERLRANRIAVDCARITTESCAGAR